MSGEIPLTHPGRYGWRFWALDGDGRLISPFTGATVDAGTLEVDCDRCGDDCPHPDCTCGIHFMPNAPSLMSSYPFSYFTMPGTTEAARPADSADLGDVLVMRQIRDGALSFALTYGVALGGLAQDWTARSGNVIRAKRFHLLAAMIPDHAAPIGPAVTGRYGCRVVHPVSVAIARDIQEQLAASLTVDELHALTARTVPPMRRPSMASKMAQFSGASPAMVARVVANAPPAVRKMLLG